MQQRLLVGEAQTHQQGDRKRYLEPNWVRPLVGEAQTHQQGDRKRYLEPNWVRLLVGGGADPPAGRPQGSPPRSTPLPPLQ